VAELITPKASITITVRTSDGRSRSVEATIYTEGWETDEFRDYDIAKQTRRALMNLLSKWKELG
jgi:hypothetical protein